MSSTYAPNAIDTTLYQVNRRQDGSQLALIWADTTYNAQVKLSQERGYTYYTIESLDAVAVRELDNITRMSLGLEPL